MDTAGRHRTGRYGEEFTHCFTGECRVNVLPILFQISQIITESEDLAASLALILKVMQERLKIARGMVTLYDREAERIFIHESFGLTDEQKARGIYSLGEGITGKVVETGKPIIVPQLRRQSRLGAPLHQRQGRATRTPRSSACRSCTPRRCWAPSAPSASITTGGC